jgi:hypothetical protein
MTCERVCMWVDVDEGNNEGVYDDVLDMEKIITAVVVGIITSNMAKPKCDVKVIQYLE